MISQTVREIVFMLCAFGAMTLAAQTLPTPAQGPPANIPQPSRPLPPSEVEEKAARERLKQQNLQRQAQIEADTAKLLQLSTELKAYVDKTNENVLSVEVIKKAAEIEKLAHSIREKMKE